MDEQQLPDISQLPSRAAEMDLFLARREEWSREHPRAWVLIVGDEVTIGDDLPEMMAEARRAGRVNAFVGRLMDPELADAAFIGPL